MSQTVTEASVWEVISQLSPTQQAGYLEAFEVLYGAGEGSDAALPQDAEAVAERAACATDIERFATQGFPDTCVLPFSALHRDFFADRRETMPLRGWREAWIAPRGYAKTSLVTYLDVLHACCTRRELFMVILSSRYRLAVDKVNEIRDTLTNNPWIRAVYGPQVGVRWNQGDIITSRGVRVLAASRYSQIRGLIWRSIRPTWVVLDDIDNSTLVATEVQRERQWVWFQSDVLKLGQSGPWGTNITAVGTKLHEDSLIGRCQRNPGFRVHFYQAVQRFAHPQAVPLWQQWRLLVTNLDDPDRTTTARAFFDAQAAVMCQEAEVLWPEKESYYDLMVERVFDGEGAFYLDKQNDPEASGTITFNMARAGYLTIEPSGLRRHDGVFVPWTRLSQIVAYYDPAMGERKGKTPDWACCVIVANDPQGYFYALDAYIAQYDRPDQQLRSIADLLWHWQIDTCGLEVNGFQGLLADDLRQALARKALTVQQDWGIGLVPVKNTKAKHVRIHAMEPLISNHWLWFADTLHHEFTRQFTAFRPIPDAGKDDGPDATEAAIRMLRGQIL